jgi:outer membrane immunogenic protein
MKELPGLESSNEIKMEAGPSYIPLVLPFYHRLRGTHELVSAKRWAGAPDMKNFLLTTTAIVMLTGGTAFAADMPAKAVAPAPILPPPTWTGPYIAGIVGVGRLNESANRSDSPGSLSPCGLYNSACSASATGFVGGVEVGYDWQDRYFVYGVSADWTWTGLKQTQTKASGISIFSHQAKIDWLASFRGRMGLAVDNTLVYVTGGLALGHLKSNVFFSGADGLNNYGALNTTKVGWVAGGGVEHKLNRNWSIKGEALYYDLGRETATGPSSPGNGNGSYSTTFRHEVIVGRVGLAYRW